MALRLAQFVCATVVLGLSSYLLYLEHEHDIGPFSRLFYSAIISSISVIASLIWLISSTILPVTHIVADLLFCGAWFAVFGLLQDWYKDVMYCGSKWSWYAMSAREGLCGNWNAVQAFAFLSAIFWFVSCMLGVLAWKKDSTAPAATGSAPAPTTTGSRRRFGVSRA